MSIFYGINYISITKRIAKANFNKRSLGNLVQYQYSKIPKIKLSDNIKSKIKSILNNWLPTEQEYIKRNAANKAWSSMPPNGRHCVHAHVVTKGGYASLLSQQAGLTPKLCKVRLTPALRTTWALRNL